MTLTARLRAWQQVHNTAPEEHIYATDAEHAAAMGLPTLAALCLVLDRLQDARGLISSSEMEAELRSVLSVAVGEGTARLRLVLHDSLSDGIPGVPTLPAKLLERLTDA